MTGHEPYHMFLEVLGFHPLELCCLVWSRELNLAHEGLPQIIVIKIIVIKRRDSHR